VMAWNGNTTETKTDIAKFISFRVKFFCFRFVSIFCSFFVSVFVSINIIKIFPLTDIFVSVSVDVNHTDCRTSSLLVWFVFINPTNNSRDSSFYQLQQFPRVYFGWLTVMIRCMKTACAWECLSACLSVISSSVRVLKQKSLCAWVTLRQLGFYQPPKCNKFNVRLTEFRWQSVPKPWTGDSEAPVTQPGVRPKYNTFVDVSWP